MQMFTVAVSSKRDMTKNLQCSHRTSGYFTYFVAGLNTMHAPEERQHVYGILVPQFVDEQWQYHHSLLHGLHADHSDAIYLVL